MSPTSDFTSIAPGRLCLFGEHQDYLGLPVIALALPLNCRIQVTPIPDSRILYLNALGDPWQVDLDNLPPKQDSGDEPLDFALAAVHEVVAAGWNIQYGARCVSTTDIPLQAGCSSSSAFCVAWVQVLARLSGVSLTRIEVAQMAHRAEVVHFGSPGGTMDHVTSALGGILRIGPGMWDVQRLDNTAGASDHIWVLADSGQPKDTLGHLRRCKDDRLSLLEKLGGTWDGTPTSPLSETEQVLLAATKTTRDAEIWAAREWATADAESLGKRMQEHHDALRDGLLLSTPRLEAMRKAALEAGAFGFKLVGSGGGGTGVAWASDQTTAKAVAKAMVDAGAVKTWIIDQPNGFPGASVVA